MIEEFNAGEEKAVGKRKSKAKLRGERENEEFRDVLSTHSGRAVIWKIMGECGIFRAGPTDKLETFRDLGRRDVGLSIMSDCLRIDGNLYLKMQKEAIERNEEV